ncbi:MAG: type II toxin-antitoxin system prevent-host-death family antitoxin [Fibrella sp.]|nr:type II toxin-antitoxin system prevent-host-death family antitoxin [Armatimonadota bacterium]
MSVSTAVLELTVDQVFRLALQLPAQQKQELARKLTTTGSQLPPTREPGCDEGKIRIAPDFNAPLPAEIEDSFYP